MGQHTITLCDTAEAAVMRFAPLNSFQLNIEILIQEWLILRSMVTKADYEQWWFHNKDLVLAIERIVEGK